jgi:hypothetical protein
VITLDFSFQFKHCIYWRNPKFILKGDFIMMLRGYKNFIVFNRKQEDSDLAANDIDSAMFSGSPRLVGDYYMVVFNTNFTRMTDDEAYLEQLENAKKILNRYKIKYKICKFKD